MRTARYASRLRDGRRIVAILLLPVTVFSLTSMNFAVAGLMLVRADESTTVANGAAADATSTGAVPEPTAPAKADASSTDAKADSSVPVVPALSETVTAPVSAIATPSAGTATDAISGVFSEEQISAPASEPASASVSPAEVSGLSDVVPGVEGSTVRSEEPLLSPGSVSTVMFVNAVLQSVGSDVGTAAPSTPIVDTVAQSVKTNTIHITGFADTGTTITVSGGASVATGTVTNDGKFDITVTLVQNAVNTLSVTAKDVAGNTSPAATVPITYDTVVPTGTIVINGGAAYTNSRSATLSLRANPDLSGVTEMNVANASSYQGWEPYATTRTWTLSTGDGLKTVRVKYRDAAGNETATGIAATITVDTVAPVVATVNVPAGTYDNAQSVTITAASDAVSTFYTLDGSAPDAGKTQAVGPVMVDGADGTTVTLKFVSYDAAGNASSVISVPYTFKKTAPVPVITVNGPDHVDVAYGDTYVDAGATATGGASVSVFSNVDTNVIGQYLVTYDAVDPSGNHALRQSRIVRVVPRPITVSADSVSKTFGETDPVLTFAITGGSLVGADTLSGSLVRAVGEEVGTYAIGQGDLSNTNYAITFVPSDLVIGKAASKTVVTCPSSGQTYTGSAQTPCSVSVSGAGGLLLSPVPEYAGNTAVGTASVAYSFPGDDRHDGSADAKTFAIVKADPVITVLPYSVTYDKTLHTALGTVVGVAGEALVGLDLSGTVHIDAGDYAIDSWIFADATGNYNAANGTVHNAIVPKPITVTAVANTKPYDGADTASGIPTTVAGSILLGDEAGFTERYETADVGTNKVLTASGIVNDGNAGNNYSYTFVPNVGGVILSAAQTVPDGHGDVSLDDTHPEAVITDPDLAVAITIASGTHAPLVDTGALMGGKGVVKVPGITIHSTLADVVISAGTTVTSADSGWDGRIAAPTVIALSLPGMEVGTAFELGYSGARLTFDKAVRISLPNQAGKRVGYVGNVFTEISVPCSADSQSAGDALPAGGECKLDVAGDLVVWTKHFTTFATYSPNAPVDASAPTTKLSLKGDGGPDWFRSDVRVTLSATDDEGGVGVDRTEYSLDGGTAWIRYAGTFTVSGEGIHEIFFRSTDKAGNVEKSSRATVRIDKTSPEADVFASVGDVGIEVDGIDTLSGVTVEQRDKLNYVLTDGAGNTTKLRFEGNGIRRAASYGRDERIRKWYGNLFSWRCGFNTGRSTISRADAELRTLQYNAGPIIRFPDNRMSFSWKTAGKEPGILASQDLEVSGRFRVDAKYDERKDRTSISISEGGKRRNVTASGLRLLDLMTSGGVLRYGY